MATTIDSKALKKGVGRVVQDTVGDMLSEIGDIDSKAPSVYIARQDTPYENYPFVIVDILYRKRPDGWGLCSWVDEDGVQWFENTYVYSVQVQSFDRGAEENALDIMHTFCDYITQVPLYRRKIKEYSGATLESVSDVRDTSRATKSGWIKSYATIIDLIDTSLISISETDSNFIEEFDLDIDNLGIHVNSTLAETTTSFTPVIQPFNTNN